MTVQRTTSLAERTVSEKGQLSYLNKFSEICLKGSVKKQAPVKIDAIFWLFGYQ